MMLVSQKERNLNTDDSEALKSSWAPSRNLPWVPTSSRRVLVTCITESMLAAARSCITRDSRAACTGVPWKRFLSLISRAAEQHAVAERDQFAGVAAGVHAFAAQILGTTFMGSGLYGSKFPDDNRRDDSAIY